MITAVWAAILMTLSRFFGGLEQKRRLEEVQSRFNTRDAKDFKQHYSQDSRFGRFSRDTFTEAWMSLARILKIDPFRLSPTDRFDRELQPPSWYKGEDERDDLNQMLRIGAKKTDLNVQFYPRDTVGDIVFLICLILESLPPNSRTFK